MKSTFELTSARLTAVMVATIVFSLFIYNFTFDRNSTYDSREALEQIAEDPEFIEYFGESLAGLTKLDTDKDGIPDVSDNDVDNDGIPNKEDADIDGDGTPNEQDPSTALTGLIGDIGLEGEPNDSTNDSPARTDEENGHDGIDGEDGQDGVDGIDGIDGDDGNTGDDGTTGADGDTGEEGDNGEDGSDGSNGTVGPKGDKGDDGDQGLTGAQGIQGLMGSIGATGANGVDGSNGATGATGATGTVGVVTDDGVIDTTLTGSSLDVQILLATGSGLAKLGTGLSLTTSCSTNQVLKWSGSAWACSSDVDTDTDTTYSASTGISISSGMISSVLGTSISGSEIDNSTITTDDIAANTITAADIATGAIESDEIANGTITTADLDDSQVTNAKVADDTLDFDVFADALMIDAATTVGVTNTNTFGISRSSGGQLLTFTDGTDDHGYYSGAGTPEGSIAADTGSLYVDTSNALLYIKGDDTDNDTWALVGGGLSRRGTITADPAPAIGESIYTLDSSGGAFNITLPAATGSQARITLIGGNVEINGTTAIVQAGEALNEVANGTFTITTDGQRIEAIDRGTGLWDLSVVGASTQSDLHRVRMSRNAAQALPLATLTDVLLDSEDYDIGGLGDTGTGTVTIIRDGTYRITAHGTNTTTSNNNQIYIRVNGAIVSRNINSQSSGGVIDALTDTITLELSAGDTVNMGMHVDTGGNTATNPPDRPTLEVIQLPTTETVLAGMITPETLTNINIPEWDAAGNSASATFNGDGTYRFDVEMQGDGSTGSFSTKTIGVELYNVTDGSSTATSIASTKDVADGVSASTAFEAALISGKVYELRPTGANNLDAFSFYRAFATHLPSSQVVDPGSVPVTTLTSTQATVSGHTGLAISATTMTNVSQLSIVIPAGKTVDIEANLNAMLNHNGANQLRIIDAQIYNSTTSTVLSTTKRVVDKVGEGTSHTEIGNAILKASEYTAGGVDETVVIRANRNAGTSGSTVSKFADGSYLRYDERATSSVIDAGSTPVNDQATSGYMDIGDMRIQWGVESGASVTQTINLPASFADSGYTVTANPRGTINTGFNLSIQIDVISATQFQKFMRYTNENTSAPAGESWSWQAIGLKP